MNKKIMIVVFIFSFFNVPLVVGDEATDAFSSGDYQFALRLYQAKYEQVPSMGTLYNIAVCHYKLGNLNDAEAAFSQVAADSDDLALYNLALVEAKLGKKDKARERFLTLSELAESEDIALLAFKQYQSLTLSTSTNKKSDQGRWLNHVSIGLGYDDSAVSVVDESNSSEGDNYSELLVSTTWKNTSNKFDVSYFKSQYFSLSQYDVGFLSLGYSRMVSQGTKNNWELRASVDEITLGGRNYLRNYHAMISKDIMLSGNADVKLKYRFTMAESLNNNFNATEGETHRIQLSLNQALAESFFELRYRYEQSDLDDARSHDDLGRLNTFTSYSAVRHGVSLAWFYALGGWQLSAEVGLRESEYNDPNLLSDDRVILREDTRLNYQAELAYMLNASWLMSFSAEAYDNQSTVDNYDYDQRSLSFTLSWTK